LWPVFEVFTARSENLDIDLALMEDARQRLLREILSNVSGAIVVDVLSATATDPKDEKRIKALIADEGGTANATNETVRGLFVNMIGKLIMTDTVQAPGRGMVACLDGDKDTSVVIAQEDLPREERATVVLADGSKYTGQWKGDLIDGNGVFEVIDGSRYEGNFVDGFWDGQGTYRWPDGTVYQGQWHGGMRSGTGVLTCTDGSRYEGQFVNDRHEGHGVCTFADGSRYDGNYVEGFWDGQGTHWSADGAVYQGQWHGSMNSGTGVVTYPDGGRYDGQFISGKEEGHGVFTGADGVQYDGEWKDGLRDRGVLRSPSGTSHIVQYEDNRDAEAPASPVNFQPLITSQRGFQIPHDNRDAEAPASPASTQKFATSQLGFQIPYE